MGMVKLVKDRSYYKRFKTKFRRRRDCKTDYKQRRTLIRQDKRKHNAPKWRLVVRVTNKDVICQIAAANMVGDQVMCAAYSHELARYGLNVGLTNYAACYCTGLLLARRLLRKLKLDRFYPGKKRLDGNMFKSDVSNVQWRPGQKIYRPFKCLLDVGLSRTTSGARVFGALKGAVDGGLDIPHSEKRFPGFTKGADGQKDEYDPKVHADMIYGEHVAKYMKHLEENEAEKYQKHFARYIAAGLNSENLSDKYHEVHNMIRENPAAAPKKKVDVASLPNMNKKQKKLSLEDRRLRRIAKIEELAKKGQEEEDNAVGMEMDDDEEESGDDE